MDEDKVSKLYANYDILANPNSKTSDHETEYLEILQSVKGDNSEKKLACQFIPRFFKDFPQLAEKALDAQLDLVEDDDACIRKQAIKSLPTFCKDSKSYVTKIADILAQMLQIDDSIELSIVTSSLMTVMKIDVKRALVGLFSQILSAEEEVIRKRTIGFLCKKLKFIPAEMMSREVEEYLLQECRKALQDATGEEFSMIMGMLSNLKVAKTIPGQQALVDIVVEQAELDKEFSCENLENIHCLLECIKNALQFLSPYVSSSSFVNYICLKVLPNFSELSKLDGENHVSLELLKLLAEIAPFANNLEDSEMCLESVYNLMLEYMPLPPMEGMENELAAEPKLHFTHIESLIYVFHQLTKKHPDFLTADENADRLKDLKIRLQFLARNIQGCIKTVKESIITKKEAKAEENKLKLIALRTMANINTLIKDLFRSPPSFKTSITLSWKASAAKSSTETATLKRKEPISVSDDSDKAAKKDWKSSRQLYSPPSGKYSSSIKKFYPSGNFGYFQGSSRGRGRRFY